MIQVFLNGIDMELKRTFFFDLFRLLLKQVLTKTRGDIHWSESMYVICVYR